jgi:hypothetical protein
MKKNISIPLAVTSLFIGIAINSSTDVSALRTPSIIHGV